MKLKVLALGIASLFLASCSEDDTKEPVINIAELSDDWFFVSYLVDGAIIPYEHQMCGKDFVEFKAEGNVFRAVELNPGCATRNEMTGQYEVNGTTISITAGGNAGSASILELTANKLVLQTLYDFDGDGDQETVVETYAANP